MTRTGFTSSRWMEGARPMSSASQSSQRTQVIFTSGEGWKIGLGRHSHENKNPEKMNWIPHLEVSPETDLREGSLRLRAESLRQVRNDEKEDGNAIYRQKRPSYQA